MHVERVLALALALLAGATGCAQRTVALPVEASPVATATQQEHGARLPGPPLRARVARVVHVTDGDTIVLDGIDAGEVHAATGGRKARLIGVDTPEVFGGADCYGREASAFTKRELDETRVLVDHDVGTLDRFGRALVYVWDDQGRFFNGRLAREGYALQLTVPPNVRYAELFTELVREARLQSRGLWAGC